MPARLVAVALVAALALTGCTGSPGSPPERPPAFAPAAAGLGDPYFPSYGNAGYQVDHYHLAVRYDPASRQLTGLATISARATAPLASFSLDLTGLEVAEVTVDGVPAGASHDVAGEKLVVTPASGVPDRAALTVTVAYQGVPEPVEHPALGSNGFHGSADGAFAVGQPRSASTWFPVNDHPLDKATYTIEVTVPDGLAAVSNGAPAGTTTSDGWTTWRWEERAPMASYLTTLAIGDYRVHQEEHDGAPMVIAVHSDLPRGVDDQLRRTGEIADTLAEWFGPYPFESYGGIALADPRVRFALETQSRPTYGPGFFRAGQDATWVIVHELAHQWFGNSVSVRYWDEIWLNEGFATYAEWLWEEADGGDTVAETFDLYWDGPAAETEFWSRPAGDPGPAHLFDRPVYVRGAMTLHALRRAVGDAAFFPILRAWAGEHRDGNVTTADLVALAERVSGRPVARLVEEWLNAAARPDHPGGPVTTDP